MVRPVISILVALSAISATAVTINKRIYNGEVVKEGEFPFLVQFNSCGGSLLDETTILTAAHCLVFMQPGNKLSVRAGTQVTYRYLLSCLLATRALRSIDLSAASKRFISSIKLTIHITIGIPNRRSGCRSCMF